MSIVIGYKAKFSNEELAFHQIELSELIGAKFELKFGRVTGTNEITTEQREDVVDQLITDNYGLCTACDETTNEVTVMLHHEVPLATFKEYYNDTPILKDGDI